MTKSYPINCVQTKKKLGKLGFDDHGKPVLWLWCKEHRIEHICTFASILQSWRGMLAGDRAATLAYLGLLKKAVGDIEADLEDMQEQSEVTG